MSLMQIALGLEALKHCLALGLIIGASHNIGPNKERMINATHVQVAMLHRSCLQQELIEVTAMQQREDAPVSSMSCQLHLPLSRETRHSPDPTAAFPSQ